VLPMFWYSRLCCGAVLLAAGYVPPVPSSSEPQDDVHQDDEESKQWVVRQRRDWQHELSADDVDDFTQEELDELAKALDELEGQAILRKTSGVLRKAKRKVGLMKRITRRP